MHSNFLDTNNFNGQNAIMYRKIENMNIKKKSKN